MHRQAAPARLDVSGGARVSLRDNHTACPLFMNVENSALIDWPADEGFAADLDSLAENADIVSFDIFDTALTRLLDSPADAFAEIERRLLETIGDPADGYAERREQAERDARVRNRAATGAEEVDLDAILDEVLALMPELDRHRTILRETELAVEQDLLVGVPDILAATRRLASRNIPFIFVSDMYLPADFLAEQLRRAGYAGWQALFVSAQTGATKASGRQWSMIRAALARPGQLRTTPDGAETPDQVTVLVPVETVRHPARSQRNTPPRQDAALRILHVGDDAHSDGSQAEACGITTLLYVRARSERRLGSSLSPALLPFSRAQRACVLAARRHERHRVRSPDAPPARLQDAPPARLHDAPPARSQDAPPARSQDAPPARSHEAPPALPHGATAVRDEALAPQVDLAESDRVAAWRDLGRVFGGIVLGGFVRWLGDRVQTHGITALQFCARDGWLVRAAWQRSGLGPRLGVTDHYLCISRRTVNLARGYLDSTPQRLPRWLLAFLSTTTGTISVGRALQRLGLAADSEIGQALHAAFGSLDALLTWPDGSLLFENVLQLHAGAVHAALREHHASLTGYLRQQGFEEPGRLALVDLGWHGTIQRSLQRLALRPPDSLCGFYYGLWQSALTNRHGAGLMEGAFASEFIPPGEQPGMLDAVGLLEELHSAPHGTVTGYRRQNDVWLPVFADHPDERRQHERATRHFQAGALETVEALFATGRAGDLSLDLASLTPDAVVAAIEAVCLSPSPSERALLGTIGHCAGYDHAEFEPLVSGPCPEDVDALIALHRRSGWRTGTMLSWYEASSGARRDQLRVLAHSLLAHQGARNLGQFA